MELVANQEGRVLTTLRRVNSSARSSLRRLAYWADYVRMQNRIRYLNSERPREFPSIVQIESSSKCNLRCRSCNHSIEGPGGKHLTNDELGEILDHLPFPIASVCLSGIGEPLLNPNFFNQTDMLAKRGIKCSFLTNGTLFTPEICRRILQRTNIEYLAISCDSAQKEVFEYLRAGADFAQWKRYVGGFLDQVNSRKPRRLEVGMNTVVSNRNFRELADIIRLAGELGFHRIHFLDILPVNPEAQKLCLTDEENRSVDRAGLNALGKSLGLNLLFHLRETRSKKELRRCLQPWEYIMVRPGGDVYPCCAIFESGRLKTMGNVLKQEFKDIWRGEAFRDFRKMAAEGHNNLCNECPFCWA